MKKSRQTRDNGFIGLISKKILEIEILGKPKQEAETNAFLYEQKARDPWGRHGKGSLTL
jgi:hypothetical protein